MKKRILVIDDDMRHLVSTREILQDQGYEVFIHDRPFGATNMMRSLQPDLVLLDVNMPALSGDKLATLFKTYMSSREIPIVLYSSNDEEILAETARELGLSGWVAKGSPASLRSRVRTILAETATVEA